MKIDYFYNFGPCFSAHPYLKRYTAVYGNRPFKRITIRWSLQKIDVGWYTEGFF